MPKHFGRLCLIALVIGAWLSLTLSALASPVDSPTGSDLIVGGACGSTIQACINAASAGDRVIIPAGTYVEHLFLNKPVSLIGAGASTTIVRADSGSWKTLSISGQNTTITASTVISGLTFTGGNSSTAGGGIGLQFQMSPTIQNVIVTGNAADEGGGIGIGGWATPLLINVSITGNVGTGAMGYGGGGLFMSGSGSSVRLINSLIADNSDGSGRGQVEVMGGTATFIHTTIANASLGTGAGILTSGGTVVVTDTMLVNQAYGLNNSAGSISGDYNLFFGNTTNRNGVSAGAHDVIGDPVFANVTAGNYHIFSSSAARAVGVNAGISTDIDGEARPSNFFSKSGFDIGYDQFVASTTLPAVVCGLAETHGLTSNGSWQNIFNSPAFTWPAAPGAEGYKVIYNNNGVHVVTTTQRAYTLPPLISGYAADVFVEPHYLADPSVNNNPGACVFTVRYDNKAPVVPSQAAFTANFPDNTWTNIAVTPQVQLNPAATTQSIHDGWLDPYASTCTPSALFTHSCESGAGLKEERTYFGTDPNGIPSALWGPVQSWTLPSVASGVYYFRLSATDNLNQSTTATTVRVLKLDTISPTAILTYTGSNPSVLNLNLPLQWGGSDSDSGIASYDVLVNGAVWLSHTAASSGIYTGVCDTTYQFGVRAYDSAGNSGLSNTQSVLIKCDLTSPAVAITSPVINQIISGTLRSIAGTASDNLQVASVAVSTDGGTTWSTPSGLTTWTYTWTVPGQDGVVHVLLARATDTVGNVTTSTPVTVTVDRVLPATAILDPANGQVLHSTSYAITGTASDGSGVAAVDFSTDGGLTFNAAGPTGSAWSYTWALSNEDGVTHWLQARAIDRAGNVNLTSPSALNIYVDNVAPNVVMTYTGSSPAIENLNLPLQWSGRDGGGIASYDVLVNGGAWLTATTATSATYTAACNTTYQFAARARDQSGNISVSSPQSVATICDPTSPMLTLWSPTAGQLITGTSATITGTASDALAVSKVEVSTDGGASWSPASGTTNWSFNWPVPVEDGITHSFLARATNPANHTTTTTPITVTIDRVAPHVTLADPVDGQIIRSHIYTLAGLAVDGSGIANLGVSTDGATYSAATPAGAWSWQWLIPDENGVSHTLRVRATDAAGNVGTPVAPIGVYVDNVPPALAFTNLVNGQSLFTTTYTLSGTVTGAVTTTLDTGSGPDVVNVVGNTFSQTLTLITGTQTITGTAIDAVGNRTLIAVNVTVYNGVPPQYIYLPMILRNYDPARDAYEPDDTWQQARPITADGTLQHRNFYPANDQDWAKLEIGPGTYVIATSGLSANTDTVLRLFASNGATQLALNDDCSSVTRASCITWTANVSTTLYIQATPYDSSSIGADRWYDLSVVRQ